MTTITRFVFALLAITILNQFLVPAHANNAGWGSWSDNKITFNFRNNNELHVEGYDERSARKLEVDGAWQTGDNLCSVGKQHGNLMLFSGETQCCLLAQQLGKQMTLSAVWLKGPDAINMCENRVLAKSIQAAAKPKPAKVSASAEGASCPISGNNICVRLTTTLGIIELELDAAKAPLTVQNFLAYMERGYYNGTIFHRVIPGFMIQGGGFVPGMREKSKGIPLKNEADNGLKNLAGTIAMARTPDPHSAGAQFFINTVDNPNLDHRDKTDQGWGYCVFGKVTKGMDVVKKIESVATGNAGRFQDVPKQDVVIEKVELIKK